MKGISGLILGYRPFLRDEYQQEAERYRELAGTRADTSHYGSGLLRQPRRPLPHLQRPRGRTLRSSQRRQSGASMRASRKPPRNKCRTQVRGHRPPARCGRIQAFFDTFFAHSGTAGFVSNGCRCSSPRGAKSLRGSAGAIQPNAADAETGIDLPLPREPEEVSFCPRAA